MKVLNYGTTISDLYLNFVNFALYMNHEDLNLLFWTVIIKLKT